MKRPEAPIGAWKTPLVGRKKEKAAIRAAIEAEGDLRVLYFVGKGGIGKTHLLRAVEEEIIPDYQWRAACQFGGSFDLYDTEIQRTSGLEWAIVAELDPAAERFSAFRQGREELESLRRAGADPQRVEKIRAELSKLFVEGFNELSAQTRVVLCLDTVESVQYESDEVQRLIGPVLEAAEIKDWLLRRIPELRNTVVILAGRRNRRLERDLREFLGGALTRYPLRPLSLTETRQYFEEVGKDPDIVKQLAEASARRETYQELLDRYRTIYYYTGGLPLNLALSVETVIGDSPLPPAYSHSWKDARRRSRVERQAIQAQVEEQLLTSVLLEMGGDLAVALPLLGITPKGINAALLERLVAEWHQVDVELVPTIWSSEKCVQVLENLRRYSFVKPRNGLTFLHDQMYESVTRCLPKLLPTLNGILPQIYRSLLGYYDDRIAAAQTERERQDLQTERLYYCFRLDPSQGYAEYSRLNDEAIMNHEISFDMRLRDEMIRYFRPDEPENDNLQRTQRLDSSLTADRIKRGLALRWTRRLIEAGLYRDTLAAVSKILRSRLTRTLDREADPYFIPILRAYRGEAMGYLGEDLPGTARWLQQAIDGLQAPGLAEPGSYWEWMKTQHLGRAHNDLGYLYARLNKYDGAVREYQSALPLLRRTGLIGQQATTLNNLAYVYALQGNLNVATALCRDAIDLWQRDRRRSGEGRGWNTLGLIFIERGIYDAAEEYCKKALSIFEELNDQRGIGLACHALGRALRKDGVRDIHPLNKATSLFQSAAEEYLPRAIGIFIGPFAERPRAVGAHNELGCTYRNWARVLRNAGLAASAVLELEEKALQAFQAGIDLALPDLVVQAADSLNDIAALYFYRQDLQNAWTFLDKSDNLISEKHPRYEIRKGRGVPTIAEPISPLWEIRGKNALVRGDIAFERGRPRKEFDEAILHYLLASAYFETYSPTATRRELTFGHIYRNLKGLGADRLAGLQAYAEKLHSEYRLPRTVLLQVFDRALGAI